MERKTSDAHMRAITKFNATKTKQVPLRFNINTDKDILERLSAVGNIQGYIKSLIRADIEKNP